MIKLPLLMALAITTGYVGLFLTFMAPKLNIKEMNLQVLGIIVLVSFVGHMITLMCLLKNPREEKKPPTKE